MRTAGGGQRQGEGDGGDDAAGWMLKIARLSRDVLVVFGATEYGARVRLRLFHAGGNRFSGVAHRIAPDPGGGEVWTPDAFDDADLLEAAEHIPSLRIVGPGCPTDLEVGDADLVLLLLQARPPRRSVPPWRRHGCGLARRGETT